MLGLPGRYDLDLYQGDSFELTVRIVDPTGTPVAASGWTWSDQIRARASDTAVLATLTATPGADGAVTVTLDAAQAAALVPSRRPALWDLQATDGTWVQTFLAGEVTITADVTRGPG